MGPKNIGAEIKGARSALARWIDAHLRLTSIAIMVAAPLAVIGVITMIGWLR